MINRRLFISRGLAALGTGLSAGSALANAPLGTPRPQLRPLNPLAPGADGLRRVVQKAGLSGEVVCAVADADTGEMLEALNQDRALPPASVAKALTTLYALDSLGPDYRFRTRILATGPIKNGVLQGDLVLAGGGDPTLDTDGLAALAATLKASGLRELRGDFKIWDGALPFVQSIDPGQPDHVGYSPAVSGLALNFNRVHFEWKRASSGWAVSMDARTKRYRPNVTTAKMNVVRRQAPVYTYEARAGVDQWTVASSALGSGGARWLPVRNPALYTGDVFQTLARAHGIVLPRPKVTSNAPNGTEIAQHQSAPLSELLKAMLKYSNNLMAEMIGMTATAQRSGTPPSLKTSGQRMSTWAKETYGLQNCAMTDHSGLGENSRLTARDLVKALSAAHKKGALRPLLKPVHMTDAKGKKLTSHPIKVSAKTGTLNFVSGLGGFITAEDGRELVFAIFCADLKARRNIKRADRERPPGARSWNSRAKTLQKALLNRWGQVYAS